MKLGLHSSIFPENLNVLEKLEYTQKAGYSAIELETGPLNQSSSIPPRNVVARFLDKKIRTEIFEQAKSNNVKICSLCYGMYMTPSYHLADPDPRYRDIAVSQIMDTIGLATDLEAEVILIFIPELANMRSLTYDQKRSLLKGSLKQIVRTAEDAGITIGLEPSAITWFAASKDILSLLAEVGSDNITCYYDVGNALGQGFQPDDELVTMGKAVTQIHIKESRRAPPGKTIPRFPSLGQGFMDWDKIFSALRKINYQRYLIVELFPDPSDPYRVAIESKNFLDKYMK